MRQDAKSNVDEALGIVERVCNLCEVMKPSERMAAEMKDNIEKFRV